MQEKYTTPQPNDQPEVQQRRRESWRAADGWTWARQTGSDPARFVLAPSKDWRAVRAARPTASDLARVLSRAVSVPAAQLPQAEFQFINDLLGSETLPAGALPKNYRQAMFEALAMNKGVVAEQHVRDPVGRAATRIALRSASSTLALYVDSDLNYLAYVGTADDGEQAYRVVTGRRHVKEIPADLLGQLGGERKEQAVWE